MRPPKYIEKEIKTISIISTIKNCSRSLFLSKYFLYVGLKDAKVYHKMISEIKKLAKNEVDKRGIIWIVPLFKKEKMFPNFCLKGLISIINSWTGVLNVLNYD